MFDFFLSPYFLLFARLCVGGVFVASAIGKMMDREGTAVSMNRYPFLPKGFGAFIAYVFPFVEMAVAVMLIFGLFTRLAALAAVLLFLLFTGLIMYDLSRGSNESCHCFGRISSEKLTPFAVVRNVFLLVLAAMVAAVFDGWLSLDTAIFSSTSGVLRDCFECRSLGVVDAVPIILLSVLTVCAIVFGGQAVSTVRTTLRAIGFR
ncbi:MAG TPA: MauE/DoxX family redox-associated membrane protein [Chloroflexia bacterium]|nr:MauE/DoxX family redox-associated membrane protein [Chloroflexia bacterium]